MVQENFRARMKSRFVSEWMLLRRSRMQDWKQSLKDITDSSKTTKDPTLGGWGQFLKGRST
jgi:hypothetical protein